MADDPDMLYGLGEEADSATEGAEASKPWLDLIEESERAGFKAWQDRADNIDKQYADMDRLVKMGRDREMQVFWANIQVLGPSVYSRPPVPVVVPRYKDHKALPRIASELLERATALTFDLQDIDGVMHCLRDDLLIPARGVAWLRFEDGDSKGKRVCIEFLHRKDFAHDAARIWAEVDWVARRAWMTRAQMKKRFKGEDWQDAAFAERKDENGHSDGKMKASVWEIWCKSADRVVWVTEGVDAVLDQAPPHLTLDGFFPCPRPVYATVERGSLVPVPDFIYYKDQLEEINALTNRISALAESIKLKGFYPAGSGEIGDAIEAAIKNVEDRAVLVPVSNWAMMGGNATDLIVWLPMKDVAQVVAQLVQLRKQLIDDVYQITGLSDIMRGSTAASETATAQQLKSQYGSIRVRDRQSELVRIARDIARITGEIIAENFDGKTLLEMTQMDIPRDADVAKQVAALKKQGAALAAQVEQAKSNLQIQQMAQQDPDKAKQAMAQVQGHAQQIEQQIAQLGETITIEKVMAFFKDQRLRPFVLDIETDSTIQPDEDAQKQRATEFVTAVGGFMREALPLVESVPQSAKVMAETLKFVAGQFRAGRDLEGAIDEFADQMEQMAGQPKPNPAAEQAQAKFQADFQVAQMKGQAEQAKMQADIQLRQLDAQGRQQDAQARVAEIRARMQFSAQQHQQDMEKGQIGLAAEQIKFEAAQLAAARQMQPPEAVTATPPLKPPVETINFKDLTPEAQSQMLAQAGIFVSAEQLQANADAEAAKAVAAKASVAPQAAAEQPIGA